MNEVRNKWLSYVLPLVNVAFSGALALWGKSIETKQVEILQDQQKLNEKMESVKAWKLFFDTVKGYMDETSIDSRSKNGLTITLLDLLTQMDLISSDGDPVDDETGKETSEEARGRALETVPLLFALLTNDDSMLSHIGAESRKKKMWLDFAQRSGNPEARATAIRALSNILNVSFTEQEIESTLLEIDRLARNGEDSKTTSAAVESVSRILGRMDQKDIATPKSQQLRIRALDLLTTLSMETHEEMVYEAASSEEQARIERENEELRMSQDVAEEAVKKSVAHTDYLEKMESPCQITIECIEMLRASDAKTRIAARKELSRRGQSAVEPMLAALNENPQKSYLKYGVGIALGWMDAPVTIPEREVAAVEKMMTAHRKRVRVNITDVLMKVVDRETMRIVMPVLSDIVEKQKNADAVFNAVRIACEWRNSSNEPERFGRERMKKWEAVLKRDRKRWENSLALIESCGI